MKKISFLLLLCALNLVSADAQDKKKQYVFHSISSGGWLHGGGANAPMVQTINGFSKGPWFAGLGLAIDPYRYRTLPVFVDLRYEFGQTKERFFIYGDAGINFDWVQTDFNKLPSPWNGNMRNYFRSGLYSDVGIGVSFYFKKENAILLSVGHTGKTLTEFVSYDDWISDERLTDTYKYHLNRITFKLGLRF